MEKSGRITVGTVAAIIAALAALITALLAYKEAKKPLIADVNCVHWKAPRSVVTDLKAIEVNITKLDPNRMTGVDANKVCSLYFVKIHNKDKNATKNTQMLIPTALHWEVNWLSTMGPQRKVYSGNKLVPLPDIQCGRKVHVKAWASCKAARPTKNEVLISQDYGDNARLHEIRPVRASMQRLDELIGIARPYLVPVAIVLISTGTILIKRRYFPQN